MTQIFSRDEALQASVEYFNGDTLAADVFVNKYALRNGEKYYEKTPDDMHKRLAKEFARIEQKYPNPMSEQEIYELLKDFKYTVPQGSPMSAIGNPFQIQSVSNCFVVETGDSYGWICNADQEMAHIYRRRGGVGLDLSAIRPKGMPTKNAAKTTDGIIPFMERFSNTTREVAQSGRRGALMETISIHHPQILDFICSKRDLKKITGANISVRVSDEFMQAVKDDTEFELRWPVDSKTPKISKMIKAREIWNELVESNWLSAEPGILFWDRIIDECPTSSYEEFVSQSTNPCSELPLTPYDSCRLMLLNLLGFLENPYTDIAKFDYDKFDSLVQKSQRLMDDLIDLELESIDKIVEKINSDPEPLEIKRVELDLWSKIAEKCSKGRRTGLGISALGDVIASLNVKYGSKESIEITEKIYKQLALSAYRSSVELAKERGPFQVWDWKKEKDNKYLNKLFDVDAKLMSDNKKYGRRNIALLTTAPAGSVSVLLQSTSGVEPAFLLSYKRRRKINPGDSNVKIDFVDESGDSWQEYEVFHHGLEKWKKITGENDITKSPYFGATSADINWMSSVELQAAATKWIDHSLSKTCNLPNDASRELISDIYIQAWSLGCKGFTIYRDGCRSGVLISSEPKEDKSEKQSNSIHYQSAPKRPEVLDCDIHRFMVKGEELIFFIGLIDNDPFEIFGGISETISIPKKFLRGKMKKRPFKSGAKYDLILGEGDDELIIKDIVNVFNNPNQSAFTRLLSLSMRHGAPIQYIVEQLQKDREADLFSFAKVVSRALKKYIQDGTKRSGTCPECSSSDLAYTEGCLTCLSCSYSKCG